MRKIISLICLLTPTLAFSGPSEPPHLRQDAPDKHIVVKGDTLWDISAKFFSDPWKWQYIWGINKEAIKDPHWIYPGNVIYLDRVHGTLSIGQPPVDTAAVVDRDIVHLSPQAHGVASIHDAVPVIPLNVIEPFLSRPLVVSEDELKHSPVLIGARDNRVMLGKDDTGFVKGLSSAVGSNMQFYRPGKSLVDPDNGKVLGIEALYLGRGEVASVSDVSSVFISESNQEITKGDRLIPASSSLSTDFLPHAPTSNISARIISIYGGVTQAGPNTVVTLNKGRVDNLEVGHVLALSRKGEVVAHNDKNYTLPDERYGLAIVFRVFDKVSYALVMQSHLPAQLLDKALTP